MMTARQMYPPAANDTATNAIVSLVTITASSMEINDEIHVSLKIPNWDVKTGIVMKVSGNMPVTSKKKTIVIIRMKEMIESTEWMEDTLVGSGSRKVRGAAEARNVCPESFSTLAVQHMILGKINQMMLSESAIGSENVQIAQGIPSAAPHNVASKVFALSSDEQAIVVDLDAASFDKTQHQMRPFQLMGFYDDFLEQTHQIPGNERRMGHATLAELATGLVKENMKFNDIRYYKQSTAFGEVEIMYPVNKSGSIDTTNVNNATENVVFEYIQRRFAQDVGAL